MSVLKYGLVAFIIIITSLMSYLTNIKCLLGLCGIG